MSSPPSILVGIAIVAAGFCMPSTAVAQQKVEIFPARTLNFPVVSCMGELYRLRQDQSSVLWGRQIGRGPFKEARGQVSVPAGMILRLCVMYEGGENPAPLAKLKGNDIQSLDLTRVDFNANIGKYLANLSQLHELTASDTEAGDTFVHDLLPLKQLECLTLNRTQISDQGLEDLAKMKSLKILSLSNNDISDKGIARLGALKSLTALHLHKARLTDAGLKALEGLSEMRYLTLTETKISDAGLASIAKMHSLINLTIDGTRVRGPGLKSLADLKHLASIIYSSGTVAPHCVTSLKKALPQCQMTPAIAGKRSRDAVIDVQ